MRTPVVLLILAALVLGTMLGRYSAPIDQPKAGSASASPPPPAPLRVAAPPPTVRPTPPPVLTPELAPPHSAPSLSFDPRIFLADLPAELDARSQRAAAGDARALVELAEWSDYCNSARNIASAQRHGGGLSGDLRDATVAAFFVQVAAVCEQWLARNPWLIAERDKLAISARQRLEQMRSGAAISTDLRNAPNSLAEVLRRRAAAAGDVIGEALSSVPGSAAMRCGTPGPSSALDERRRINQCVYALAHEQLTVFLARPDAQVFEAMPRIIMRLAPQLANSSEFLRFGPHNEVEVRWTLVACQYGLNCGPTGRALRWACSTGYCGYRHFRDYAMDRLLPPASMRLIEGQLPRLIAAIQARNVEAILGPPPQW